MTRPKTRLFRLVPRMNLMVMNTLRWVVLTTLLLPAALRLIASDAPQKAGAGEQHTRTDAERMIRAAEGRLAPVYAPLAEEMAEKLALADTQGVGIDLGSGPGTLIIELCKHTKLHWINADINPHFFPYFVGRAEAAGYGGRVSALRADACALPFRDGYAEVIVSRGSLQLWPDLHKGLSEIRRVLKPGGVAYIGRGFPEKLPPEIAKTIRGAQSEGLKYDPDQTEQQLREIMKSLQIEDYQIIRPRLHNPEGVNYGVWLRFHKAIGSKSQ